jgi:SAM-dependent methyltransferase
MKENAVLGTIAEREDAIAELVARGLPLYSDRPKNWDNLVALSAILDRSSAPPFDGAARSGAAGPFARFDPATARVLDAGASGGVILPWLARCGYKNLVGVDLDEHLPPSTDVLRYERADLTRTPFPDGSFDAITCLSVIEHGVPVDDYLAEMSRLLKPGGILVTSTDYWHEPIDTSDNPHGDNWRIFTPGEIQDLIARAGRDYGLTLSGPLDLACQDKVVHWEYVQRDYTFVVFTLVKRP